MYLMSLFSSSIPSIYCLRLHAKRSCGKKVREANPFNSEKLQEPFRMLWSEPYRKFHMAFLFYRVDQQ
ncbi:hypothetical protein Nit79A3_0160 [Nitrosomonas sp. Is79A3]